MTDTKPALETITATEFRAAEGVGDWPVLGDGATTFFRTDSLATSAKLVQAISEIPGIEQLRPDIDVRPGGVTVRLIVFTDAWAGMTREHVELARRISAAAERLGLRADPSDVQAVQPIVVGATDIKKVMPFWKALMGYDQRADSPDEDIVDPRGRGPGIWFEHLQDPTDGRPRMHVAVWVPLEQAQARVDAAIAAGGRLIFDKYAPAWWTLADPEGNEADVATTVGRDD
jgi:4a-hydroxytetrahydrobiopterin dehydratase